MPSMPLIARLTSSVLGGADLREGWVEEAISMPTRAQVLVQSDAPFDGEKALGGEVLLELLDDQEATTRWFHLVVTDIRWMGERSGRHLTLIDLQHEVVRLGHRFDVRMFQEKTAQEIIAAVFDGASIASDHIQWHLTRTLRKRNYCVQYRESDFAFISRLLEDEGIFYLAVDDDSATHLRFVDSPDAFTDLADPDVPLTDGAASNGIDTFELEHRLTTDLAVLTDSNYETPTIKLEVSDKAADPPNGSSYEPWAGHTTKDEGKALVKLRAEELAAGKVVGFGRSVRADFQPGAVFHLTDATQASLDQKYVLRRVRHSFRVRASEPTPGDTPDTYRNDFECHPKTQPYRPARSTPRPLVHGSQSIVVTGASGEEIHTEKLGRLKGKFFWDRVGKDDDTSSPWIRLVHLPIGGSLTLARVGWEMTVQHIHGLPDRPVAVSRTYNASKPSPYGYPGAGSKLSLQTASSPGGGKTNEIRMSDGSGGMEYFVNASKDMSESILNDKNEKVDVNAKLAVGVDSTGHVGASQKLTIGAAQTTKIGAASTVTVDGNRTKTVGASETVTITGDETLTIKGSDTETIGAGFTQVAGDDISRSTVGSQTLTVGAAWLGLAAGGVSFTSVGAKTESIGAAKIILAAGKASETVYGAVALTVGAVSLHLAAADHGTKVKGASAVTVGGAAIYTGGGDVLIKGSSVKILVGGMANFLGAGGILNVTPGSVAFVGNVSLDASGEIQLTGSPNLIG